MKDAPSGWVFTKLGEIVSKLVDGSHNPPPVIEGGLPMLSARNIVNGQIRFDQIRTISKERFAFEHTRTRLDVGDVLLTIVGAIGRSAVVSAPLQAATFQRSVAVITPIEVLPAFLRWQFEGSTFQKWMQENAKGTAQKGVYLATLAGATVSIPPLAEQRRIVARIEALRARSGRARVALEVIPALMDRYRKAILAAAFRGDLTADWREEHPKESTGHSLAAVRAARAASELTQRRRTALSALLTPSRDLPDIPESWAWICLEELASDQPRSIQSGPFGSALLHSEFQAEGRLVIGIDNVQDGYFSSGSQNRISEQKYIELERFAARPNDVLISVMATVGRTCVVPLDIEPSIVTKHLYRISVDNRLVLPQFVMNALRGSEPVLEQMGASVRGQTRPGLNGEIIKSLFIPVAPMAEQDAILTRIEAAFNKVDRIAEHVQKCQSLLERLDGALLAKAFHGELVPQDPAEEPASVLLDRIRAEREAAAAAPRRRGRPARQPTLV